MKKVFLSAIMMIAFVGTSMANDVAEKKVANDDPCQDVCHLAYDLARSEGADHATADAAADLAYGNCMRTRNTNSQPIAAPKLTNSLKN